MSLAPCPSCSRHVRADERACPFCGAGLALTFAAPRHVPSRLGRAAMFTIGAAVVAVGASACNTYGAPPPDAAPSVDAASNDAASTDAGNDVTFLAMYGGPPPDAGNGDT